MSQASMNMTLASAKTWRAGGLQTAEKCFRAIFDLRAWDRLALGRACRCIAEIIRVVFATPLGPTGNHRLSAIIAGHKAAQREVLADILAGRCIDLAA